jgi:hypothetical protein
MYAVSHKVYTVKKIHIHCVVYVKLPKGTVQRKLTGVESGINRKVFLPIEPLVFYFDIYRELAL